MSGLVKEGFSSRDFGTPGHLEILRESLSLSKAMLDLESLRSLPGRATEVGGIPGYAQRLACFWLGVGPSYLDTWDFPLSYGLRGPCLQTKASCPWEVAVHCYGNKTSKVKKSKMVLTFPPSRQVRVGLLDCKCSFLLPGKHVCLCMFHMWVVRQQVQWSGEWACGVSATAFRFASSSML